MRHSLKISWKDTDQFFYFLPNSEGTLGYDGGLLLVGLEAVIGVWHSTVPLDSPAVVHFEWVDLDGCHSSNPG